MTDLSPTLILPDILSPWSEQGPAPAIKAVGSNFNPGAVSWTANYAGYVPFVLPWDYPVARMFYVNGTSQTGAVDLGIYDDAGSRIFSTGSTGAGAGIDYEQMFETLADPLILPRGAYYFAIASAGSASRFVGSTLNNNTMRGAGILLDDAAFPLPAQMAPAAVTANIILPLFGVTRIP